MNNIGFSPGRTYFIIVFIERFVVPIAAGQLRLSPLYSDEKTQAQISHFIVLYLYKHTKYFCEYLTGPKPCDKLHIFTRKIEKCL